MCCTLYQYSEPWDKQKEEVDYIEIYTQDKSKLTQQLGGEREAPTWRFGLAPNYL